MKENITLFLEKNVPTDPSKWQYYVSQAKKKFDVYPSAYANGWAAKQYKDAGGGWKTEGVDEPQHVAQGLPQTKELKGKLIGEKLIKYFSEIGLKHACYQNESGEIKVIGLNKEQVKEAIERVVSEYKKMKEINEAPSPSAGEKIQKLNDRIKALKDKLSATKSPEQKNLLQQRIKNALQTLSNYKKGYSIKAPHTEGFPGGTGVGLTFPNGTINGSPSEDDIKKMRDKLDSMDESLNPREDALLKTFKNIVDTHSALKVKDGGRTTLVDVQSANAVLKLYDALSDANKKTLTKMPISKMIKIAFEVMGKR